MEGKERKGKDRRWKGCKWEEKEHSLFPVALNHLVQFGKNLEYIFISTAGDFAAKLMSSPLTCW